MGGSSISRFAASSLLSFVRRSRIWPTKAWSSLPAVGSPFFSGRRSRELKYWGWYSRSTYRGFRGKGSNLIKGSADFQAVQQGSEIGW